MLYFNGVKIIAVPYFTITLPQRTTQSSRGSAHKMLAKNAL